MSENKKMINIRALLIAERIHTREISETGKIASSPLVFELGDLSKVAVFRYGAVVFFDTSKDEEKKFIKQFKKATDEMFKKPILENVQFCIDPDVAEDSLEGTFVFKEFNMERLQLLAEVLAKSLILQHYESAMAANMERIESVMEQVRKKGLRGFYMKPLLDQTFDTFRSLHKIYGFATVTEKPDLLWEYPQLERFNARLEEEYELKERQIALERKEQLIFRIAQTVIDLLETRRGHRLEWYIIFLILAEIVIYLYDLFWHP